MSQQGTARQSEARDNLPMTSVRKALGISFIERYALIVLSLVSYVVIARLLTPNDIGLYSVTTALIGLAQVVRDFGVGNYLIQEKELTPEKVETAFGLSLVSGLVIFGLAFAAAPWIGHFYADSRFGSILRIVCLNFLILPFCSIALSMLRRAMEFRRLLFVNLFAATMGFVVTIGFAASGLGASSLAWGTVACNFVTAACAWFALGGLGRPKRVRLVAWRGVFAYGRQSTFAAIVVSAAMDVNDLVVGKLLGFTPVAILSRAMGLMNLFQRDAMGAARAVAFPAFAAAHRAKAPLEPAFVTSFALITGLGWPFYGFLCLFPLESLRLTAGAQWDAAVPLVIVFAAAGAAVSTSTLTQTLILAMGRVDLATRADLIVSLLRLSLVVATALISKDLMAVAIALLVSYVVQAPIFFAYKHRCLPNDWSGLVHQGGRSMAAAAVALLVPAVVSFHAGFGRSNPIDTWTFLAVCLVTVVGWVVALQLFGHPIASDPLFRRIFSTRGLRRDAQGT